MPENAQCTASAGKKLTHEDYTVGWICPLEVELIAALEMLDEEHEGLPQPPSDHTVYTLGSIAGKNVVIAGLWKPGNNAAATVVTQMRMTFPNVRFGLLVGIGGGVPAMTEYGRIHLGDVVVSKPTGIHSGVVQYDHGKAYSGHFERTGALAPHPAVLLQAAQDLAARRARWRRDPLVDNIMRIDTSIRSLSRFRYPGADKDHLYPPENVHQAPGVSCRQSGCDTDQRIMDHSSSLADEDDDALPSIVVHRGTIASGELVVKNGMLRDKLARDYGVLRFEMETAGALADFPCLAIRGVSDYCDSHKNDDWHGYAAAAAAAYARQLLFHLPIDQVTKLAQVPMIERKLDKLVSLGDDHERQEILEFISTLDHGAYQADMLCQRHEGSGQWLLEAQEFRSWITSNQILFCPGIPGAGKTIMTSIVVEHLQQQFLDTPTVGIAYFFCNFSQQPTVTVATLTACLLKQLAQNVPQIPIAIRDLFVRYQEHKIRPQLQALYRCLNVVASELSQVYIVIDALDECEEGVRNHVLSKIIDLQSNHQLSFFATSRFVPDITSQFEQYPWLEIRAHENDVKSYLSGQIVNLRPFVKKDASLQELIIQSIADAIDGMFLLARLHIDSLRKTPSVKLIKSALQSLPTGSSAYNHAYHGAMERINSQAPDFQKLAMQTLSWLVCAKERLTLTELQHALGVEVGSSALDEENLPDIECLISSCAGLVAFDEHSHVIRLVHYTTQQFFEETWTDWFPNAHAEMAQTCITYLNFDVFGSGSCQTDDKFFPVQLRIRLDQNPLYKYAALSWDFHARLQPVDENLLHDFLKDDGKVTASFQVLRSFRPHTPLLGDEASSRISGLHLAAFLGFIPGVERLLIDADANVQNDDNETPLGLAVNRGHRDVVNLLMTRGAAIDLKDKWGHTPLRRAIDKCDIEMVKCLLGDGADPAVVDDRLFSHAAWRGHEEICKLLLQKASGLQAVSERCLRMCLPFAADRGSTGDVQLLLDAGADATCRVDGSSFQHDDISWAPLCRAAQRGHETTVMLLLDRTTNNDTARQINQLALVLSAQNDHEKIIKILIQRGIDPNSKRQWAITPLMVAAYYDHAGAINALLENGASANIAVSCHGLVSRPFICSVSPRVQQLGRVIEGLRDGSVDITPLALAARRGNRVICRRLLFYTAATDQEKKQQLLWACHGGYEMVVEVLLEEDTHADCCDQAGRTPLSIAAECGHEAIARRLLEKDAAPRSKDITGQTPLSYALENRHKELFYLLGREHRHLLFCRDMFGRCLLLLSAGIDDPPLHRFILEATSENESFSDAVSRDLALVQGNISGMDTNLLRTFGGNCLLWAVRNSYSHVASHLLRGVDPNCRDRNGSTPLAVAVKVENEALAKLLLGSGANPSLGDRFGNTPLSWAIFHQNEKLLLLLLNHNVDLSMRNPGLSREIISEQRYAPHEVWREGMSPLALAVCSGSENVIAAFLHHAVWASEDYEAALLQAVRARKISAIKLLLGQRLDKDVIHNTLLEAILDKQEDTVRLLLDDGLGQHYELNEDGIRLMFIAALKGLHDVVKFMLDKGADCDCRLTGSLQWWKGDQHYMCRLASNQPLLLIAAQEGHEAVVNLLLKHGADPNLESDEGEYPLRAAMGSGHRNVVQILSEKTLDFMEAVEYFLVQAAKDGDLPMVENLLDEAVGVKTRGRALCCAAKNNHEAVVRTLLTAQADPDCQLPEEEWMPVRRDLAITKGRRVKPATARREDSADPDILGRKGRTALSLAAEKGRQPIMEVLLNHKATVDAADEHSRTPLFFATMNGHEAAVRTLLNYGSAAAHTLTSAQRTALSVARDFGWTRIAVLLSDQAQAAQSASPDASEINCAILSCDNCCCEIRDPNSPPRCSVRAGPSSRKSSACNESTRGRSPRFKCDGCFCSIPNSDFHFHCPICTKWHNYSFDLCVECFRAGSRCHDKLHTFHKRSLKAGEIVLERIIRSWSTDEE